MPLEHIRQWSSVLSPSWVIFITNKLSGGGDSLLDGVSRGLGTVFQL